MTGITVAAPVTLAEFLVGSPTSVLSGGGSVTFYEHTQTVPATVWTVHHNLGRRPAAVAVFSADWNTEYGDYAVTHVDVNTLYITADIAIAGKALVE